MTNHRYTKVTRQSWLQNLFNSTIGAILGVALFFGSFFVLWMNEGKINWSQVAATSTSVSAAQVDPSNEGRFVSVTGPIVSSEQLGDASYLKAGSYLRLERVAEMYAWSESTSSETEKHIGGDTTTTTNYEYTQGWTSSPSDSSKFEYSQNHYNPPQEIKSADWTVQNAQVGGFGLNGQQLEMPGSSELALNATMIDPASAKRLNGGFLFFGKGTLSNPQIGDTRISYRAVPSNTQATVFGTQQASSLVPFQHKSGATFYRALEGERAAAISTLQTEHNFLTWVLRLAGFFMMWIGMRLVFGPITAFLNVLPILGNMSGFAIGGVTFVAALAMTTVTVIISLIAHNPIALILVLLLIGGGIAFWARQRAQRGTTHSAAPSM